MSLESVTQSNCAHNDAIFGSLLLLRFTKMMYIYILVCSQFHFIRFTTNPKGHIIKFYIHQVTVDREKSVTSFFFCLAQYSQQINNVRIIYMPFFLFAAFYLFRSIVAELMKTKCRANFVSIGWTASNTSSDNIFMSII